MIISVKIESIAFAVSKSKGALQRTIPPKGETLSVEKAFKYASFIVEALATPQGMVCLKMAQVGSERLKSSCNLKAESMSK